MADQPNPDFDKIRGPSQVPSEAPDASAKEEIKDSRLKALTAAQRADRSHAAHLQTLDGVIAFHAEQNGILRGESNSFKNSYNTACGEREALAIQVASLERTLAAVSWMGSLANSFVTFGAILIGVGGCPISAIETMKGAVSACGIGFVISGAILSVVSWLFKKMRPKLNDVKPLQTKEETTES
jgi:uncharacterized membrane protein